jgi:hypothetical protein
MAWGKAAATDPSEPRSESELKRLRAYEGLVVVVFVIAVVLACGGTIAIALSSSLDGVARTLGS